jgi:hypothetical protein
MRAWIAAAALAVPVVALAAKIDPGNWEFTVNTEAHGLGAFQPRERGPQTKTRCVTPAEAANPAKVVSDAAGRGNCELSNEHDTGSDFTFDVSCSGRVDAKGSGKLHYSAESLQGNLDLDAHAQGLHITTKSDISGRRIGPCSS